MKCAGVIVTVTFYDHWYQLVPIYSHELVAVKILKYIEFQLVSIYIPLYKMDERLLIFNNRF